MINKYSSKLAWLYSRLRGYRLLIGTLLIMSLRYLILTRWVWIVEAFWAFVLVGSVIYNAIPVFTNSILVSLGKISYSYYLWHFLILYAMTPLLIQTFGGGVITLLVNMLISVIITVPVAHLSYRFIEQNQWTRRVSRE